MLRNLKNNLSLTILALPAIVFLFVFNYIPIFGLVLPFKDFKYSLGIVNSPWCGLKNFEFLFRSKDAWIAIRNTVLYNLVFIFLGIFIAVSIALILFEMSKKFVRVSQTVILLPFFISYVVVAYAVNAFLDADHGLINTFLQYLGKDPVLWYNSAKYWPLIITITAIWKGMGYGSLIYYATLMGTNLELYEAARVDGASKFKQIWHISLPSLRPIISIMLILDFGQILNANFGLFYNVPQNCSLLYSTTDVLSTFTYRTLMNVGNLGMSSATTFVQSVVGFFLVLLCNWVVRKVSEENALF